MGRYAKNLVIVESPSKSRTIEKILGRDYVVKASFGHIRDLPKSKLGIDVEHNFEPEYRITPDKQKVVKELKSYIGKDTVIYLASDDDREGWAIAWHLEYALNIKHHVKKRVIFHEITKKAILHAIENPVPPNQNLVDAQQARRILDRIVGYGLSPLLWTKIKYGLSAGRVQSATVRIVVDREREIEQFIPDEFWKLKLDILSKPSFKAELAKVDNKSIKVKNKEEAYAIKNDCDQSDYVLNDIVEKESVRNPQPAFTTSSLQQAASSKLGFGVKQTMSLAQRLYEGSISIPQHDGGLITYMRTDSITLSEDAVKQAKSVIYNLYGKDYTIGFTRQYKNKSKGAQEAHEAIRPTNMSLTPNDIKKYLDAKEYKLYKLIWSRAIATQMAPAKVANTTYKILGGTKKNYEFVSKGTKILFPGFMKAYDMGDNDTSETNDNDEKILPIVEKGTVFKDTKLTAEQNFTKPPSRYNEASLVKKLETAGIGRPATYASTISTILTREYVERTKDKKLMPTTIGTVVNDFLVKNFPNIVDLEFTAKIEKEIDMVAEGKVKWQDVISNFYKDFIKVVDSLKDVDRVQYSEAIVIGVDEKSGKDILARSGQYGNYIQIGETNKEKGIKAIQTSSVPKGIKLKDITLEDAKYYLRVPRVLGNDKDGNPIKVAIGKFGPYLQVKSNYYSIREPDDPYTIELERASEIIKTIDEIKASNRLWEKKDTKFGDIEINKARYGYLISITGKGKVKKGKYKLPKKYDTDEKIKKLTFKEVSDILSDSANRIVFNKKKRK